MLAREVSSNFVARVLVTIGLVLLAALTVYFLGKLIDVLLLLFASVLLAAAITGVRSLIQHLTPLSAGWSLAAKGRDSMGFWWPQLRLCASVRQRRDAQCRAPAPGDGPRAASALVKTG